MNYIPICAICKKEGTLDTIYTAFYKGEYVNACMPCKSKMEKDPGENIAELIMYNTGLIEGAMSNIKASTDGLTKQAAKLLKARLSDCKEDYPVMMSGSVLKKIEEHNETLRLVAVELIKIRDKII